MSIGKYLADIIYPHGIKCIICGEELPIETPYCVCERCVLERNTTFCLNCGRPVPPMNSICGNCYSHTQNFVKARSVFAYKDNAAALIKRFKYGGARYLARPLAEFMADVYHEEGFECSYITYVPLHEKRLRSRGYNQAELLALRVGEILGLPVLPMLRKTVHTKNMARLDRAGRARLIVDTFAFDTSVDLRKKSVLLIDDVMTTGATVNECARVLLQHRVGEVNVLTVASTKSKELLIYERKNDNRVRKPKYGGDDS